MRKISHILYQQFNLKEIKNIDKWGIFYGVMVGVIFGIIPLITVFNKPQIFNDAVFSSDSTLSVKVIATVTRAAAVSFFNDSGTIFATFFVIIGLSLSPYRRKKGASTTNELTKLKNLIRSKAGVVTMIAGLFGGPIGNTLFFALFIFITPSIGSVFFVLEPIFTAILAFIVLKRKQNRKALVGLVVVVTLVSTIILVQAFSGGGVQSRNVILALVLGFLGILAYSLETFLIDVAVSMNKVKGLEGLHYLQLKGVSSALFGLILLPILGTVLVSILPSSEASRFGPNIGFLAIANLFSVEATLQSSGLVVIPIVVALTHTILLFLGRIVFYRGIQRIGATLTNTLFQIQVIVTPIAAGLLFAISQGAIGKSKITLYSQPLAVQITFWVLAVFVVIASMYVALNKNIIKREVDAKHLLKINQARPFRFKNNH